MTRLCLLILLAVAVTGCAAGTPMADAPMADSPMPGAPLAAKPAPAASPYRAFADQLLQAKPEAVTIRSDLEARLDALAAAARRSSGRTPVTPSDRLRTAARAQALEMAQGNYVGHQSKSGYRFKHRFAAFADPYVHGNHGENAARDRQPGAVDAAKAERLFGQWLDSAGHRRNLMNPNYRYVSTGAVAMGHHLYAVQIFWER